MTKHIMSAMEALSFPEGTWFIDGLEQRLVRSGEGFFCLDCQVNHDAHALQFTSLRLEKPEPEPEDEFMVSGLDTRFVHRDEDGDFWIYFSEDEEAEGHAGWIFGSSVERAFSKAKTGGFAWLDMTSIDFPDEGKNLCRKDDILGFYLNNPSRIILQEVEYQGVPSTEESLARIAKALERTAEALKKTAEEVK